MKLSELIPHTSTWTGISETHVGSVARVLRPAGLISSQGRGPGGAVMTADDKINLLLGVCGVEIANRAAESVRVWQRLVRADSSTGDKRFAFTRARSVKDFFVGLITKDLNGGALDTWLRETGNAFDRVKGMKAAVRHHIMLDLYVDEFELTFVVSRNRIHTNDRTEADTISVRFLQPPPGAESEFVYGLRSKGYKAGSKLIRRLDDENIRGWGACLTEDIARS